MIIRKRNYWVSSSFKMALLFTILLGISICSFIYAFVIYADVFEAYKGLRIVAILAIVMMLLVILISFFISIFVVRGINDISTTADLIIGTGDFSQRIDVHVRWDDLSNLGFILNQLIERVESLISDIKSVSDNIAHDLRTPLTRLLNNLQLLDDQPSTENIKNAISEGERLLKTFNALLRISYIEYGKQKLDASRFSLDKVLKDVIDFYEPMFEEKHIKYLFEGDEVSIYGDRDLIFQSIANIIDNALKFMSLNDTLSIKLQNINGSTHLIIADTGTGLTNKVHTQIFDRFYREDQNRMTPGNGLGLALTKVIIEKHGGKIKAYDNNPKGLCIEIIL